MKPQTAVLISQAKFLRRHPSPMGINWSEHWTNGGTAVTRFSASDLPIYEQAIADWKIKCPEQKLWVEGGTLHKSKETHDLSNFWDHFEQLKKGQPK